MNLAYRLVSRRALDRLVYWCALVAAVSAPFGWWRAMAAALIVGAYGVVTIALPAPSSGGTRE